MARNKTAVKKFIVTLSDEERGALTALNPHRQASGAKAAEGPHLVES